MFEGRKIKNLLSQLALADSESDKSKVFAQINHFGKTVIPHVVKALHSKELDPLTCKSLFEKIVDASYLDDIVSMTGDNSDIIRGIAKEIVLKKFREQAVQKLIDNIQNTEMHLKRSARELLCSIKSQAGVVKLISIFNTADVELKKSIVNILSATGGHTAARLLISAIKDSNWSVRIWAVRGLGKVKDPDSVQPLIEILNEKDPQLKKSALDALGGIGDKRAIPSMLILLKDDDIIIRQKAMEYLCQIGDAKIVPDIMELLRDADVNVRRCAVEILNNLKDPKTGEELAKAMKDSDWWVRQVATDALADLKGDRVIALVTPMLHNPDENIRRCAVEFFNKVHDPSAFEPLVKLLKDEDWWVREKAAGALGKLKDSRAIQPLTEIITDDEVKRALPSAFGEIGGKEAIEPLLQLFNDPGKEIRIEALKAFGKLKEQDTVSAIKKALDDPEEEVRTEAVAALKNITGKVFRTGDGKHGEEQETVAVMGTLGVKFPEGSILTEAIVVIDICNSTAIADKYGNQFALNLDKILSDKALSIAEQENCQFMKSTGDGFLILFKKVENALRFCLALLKDITTYNNTANESEAIDIRIAINMGETRVDGKGDRLGLAVNMAFRVEGVKAENIIEIEGGVRKEEMPGRNRILVTENIVNELENIKGVKARLLGLFDLKGITGLHRIFQIIT